MSTYLHPDTVAALNSSRCVDELERFTARLNEHVGYVEPVRVEDPITAGVAEQIERGCNVMEYLHSLPYIGALFFKTV